MANIFAVNDPRGCLIICTETRWNNHILIERPWMAGWEKDVSRAVQDPIMICEDSDFENRIVYYYMPAPTKTRYLKVVVHLLNSSNGEVITAFPTDSGKSVEKIIWPPSID
jgi:hypothetical protein